MPIAPNTGSAKHPDSRRRGLAGTLPITTLSKTSAGNLINLEPEVSQLTHFRFSHRYYKEEDSPCPNRWDHLPVEKRLGFLKLFSRREYYAKLVAEGHREADAYLQKMLSDKAEKLAMSKAPKPIVGKSDDQKKREELLAVFCTAIHAGFTPDQAKQCNAEVRARWKEAEENGADR